MGASELARSHITKRSLSGKINDKSKNKNMNLKSRIVNVI